MQEHPVPRQITTFEFKLIGELTIKQFGYLAFGAVFAIVLFFLTPAFFYLNFAVASLPALLAIGFAFVPVNERPMDLWLRNLIKRFVSPTQYFYHKHNLPPKIMMNITLPPKEVLADYVRAQQKLNEYVSQKPKTTPKEAHKELDAKYAEKARQMAELISTTNISAPPTNMQTAKSAEPATATSGDGFTFDGQVLSPKGVPLANILVYLKKGAETVRLFKTDAEGSFKNNILVPKGDYVLELEDSQKRFDFARMKVDGSRTTLQISAQRAR